MEETRIRIEDNQILCCSQMCTQDCYYYGICKPVPDELVILLLETLNGNPIYTRMEG